MRVHVYGIADKEDHEMETINSIQSINAEIARRCNSAGLQLDCGSGGLFNSTIALVAEAPGEREVALKQPLIGSSGSLLFDCLRKEGLTRNHVYITNVVKRKLVSAATNYSRPKAPISRNELEHWRALLLDELSLLPNLRFVVALGDYALNALCGLSGITNWRGSVVDCRLRTDRVFRTLVTYNPAYPQREPRLEVVFRMDLGKLKRVMNGTHRQPRFIEHINPSYLQAMEYVAHCRGVGSRGTPISVDIETFGPRTETVCIGLAHSNDEGLCVNFRNREENTYSLIEERELRLAIQHLLGDSRVRLIAQNSHFDATWMWYKDRIRWSPVWIDTMLAHHVLYPLLPHKLAFLTSQYTDHPYYKDDAKDWRDFGSIDDLWHYNVKDVCITRMAAFKLLDELREQGLERFYFDYVAKLAPELVQMTVLGIKCDTKLKESLNESIGREVEAARARFDVSAKQATGNHDLICNPLSTHDVGDLFFRQIKLVGRGSSVDEQNRIRSINHPHTTESARTVVRALDEFKKLHKFHSTYVESEADPDGRYRCAWKQTGVNKAPGRLSSAENGWGTASNMQFQPEAAKPMFVADEGYGFSYFDMSQIEARIVAWLANITRWKEQFELARLNPGAYDAHCALAADMYKVPYEQVPRSDYLTNEDGQFVLDERGQKIKTIRYIAKRCRHGLNYRMGPDRLAIEAGLALSEAAAAYSVYHRATPELQLWWDSVVAEVRQSRCLYNAFGRRLIVLERITDESLESIIAFKPQSTNGDHVARVIYQCHSDHEWPQDACIVLNIHDALIALHRLHDGECVRKIMKRHAETPILINGESLIVPAEMAMSHPDENGIHRWSTIRKIK